MAKKSPCVYARYDGAAILAAMARLEWTQSELARKSATTSPTISTILGIVGRRVAIETSDRIAEALGGVRDDFFTTEAPDGERIGQRTRPATPATQRYSGDRKIAESESWRAYLKRVREAAEPIFEWPAPLSANQASQRFEVDLHLLIRLADEQRVRSLSETKPRGARWYSFNERELHNDLQALPRCGWESCSRIANESGRCGFHEYVDKARGQPRPRDVVEKITRSRKRTIRRIGAYEFGRRIAESKRGKQRPDVGERVVAMHNDRSLRADWGYRTFVEGKRGATTTGTTKRRWKNRKKLAEVGPEGPKAKGKAAGIEVAEEALRLVSRLADAGEIANRAVKRRIHEALIVKFIGPLATTKTDDPKYRRDRATIMRRLRRGFKELGKPDALRPLI